MSRVDHAYALGCIAAGGRIHGDQLEVRVRGRGSAFLRLLRAARGPEGNVRVLREDGVTRVWAPLSPLLQNYVLDASGPKVVVPFPNLARELSLAFCRGIFDVAGVISHPDSEELVVRMMRQGEELETGLLNCLGVAPSQMDQVALEWVGAAALDVLGFLYDGLPPRSGEGGAGGCAASRAWPARKKHLKRYWAWCRKVDHFAATEFLAPSVFVQRVHPDAVIPSKGRVSDSGYDLTVIHRVKSFGPTVLYGTGISIEPPQGWYFDVVARSSIIKLGYMISNSIGVIDRAYRGEIMVPLIKLDPDAPELALPARIAQLIPRPIVHFPFALATDLGKTHRGTGGFGSTG